MLRGQGAGISPLLSGMSFSMNNGAGGFVVKNGAGGMVCLERR
jgi:hypothetical protein